MVHPARARAVGSLIPVSHPRRATARASPKRLLETEVKLPVKNLPLTRRRLRELGFEIVHRRELERNYLVDFPEATLRSRGCLLRLRFQGEQCWLTFKGPSQASPAYKIRREIETEVGDGLALKRILEQSGLSVTFRYEKYRTTFARRSRPGRKATALVVLDETPIGSFLELEGPPRWIDKLIRQLGYSREQGIRESYASLYYRQCRARGQVPGNMLFGNASHPKRFAV